MTGTIYRRAGKSTQPITTQDFYSQKEKGDTATDKLCQRWGTSVWINIEHLRHDIEVITYLKKYQVVAVDITPMHGVIQRTHSDNYPEHRTFWRDRTIDFGTICKIIYSPDSAPE